MENQELRPLGQQKDQSSDTKLATDLEQYRKLALQFGASGAKIIPAKTIKVDERVRLKCLIPRCERAGETPNCPPNAPDLDLIRRALSIYSAAVLFKCDVEIGEIHFDKEITEAGKKQMMFYHKKGVEVAAALERQAFKDGYHLAMGMGGGSCKDYLCEGKPCQFLKTGNCRFPLQSRPSLEAMGIDVTELINEAGWSSYALLDDLSKIPAAITAGLVLIC
jgi:predicted metal-binding protein